MKYGKKIVKKITNLLESDDYTVAEICQQVGIVESTYYEWKATKEEFSEALAAAEEKRLQVFRKAARSGLLVLLKGKEYEEVTTEFIESNERNSDGSKKPKIKSQKKVKKFIPPNAASVAFALKNLDSDNFVDMVRNELTGKGGKPLPLAAPSVTVTIVKPTDTDD